MKGFLLPVILLVTYLLTPSPLSACEKWQDKVERYTALQRQGGSAKQMNHWRTQKKFYSAQYLECLRSQPRIHRAAGIPQKGRRPKTDYQPPRNTTSDNSVVQQLLATCNFWIETYNNQPTSDHKSFRDGACRKLDSAEQNPPIFTTNSPLPRSAKECIKPNNLIDAEVYQCMSGKREPYWR